ncbi:MAG: sugar transferase [Lachnospiraceae bacterium]|nr:sugar transferase [Lachnospiraceae bacterium]
MKYRVMDKEKEIRMPLFTPGQRLYLKIQRGYSFAAALAALVVLSPLFLVLCIWELFSDGFPILFIQKRVGTRKIPEGKTGQDEPAGELQYFPMMKFRSMYKSTPHDMPTHLLQDPEQYITGAGKFLRKTSLDELPQLINVLKGDMNLVGPRPALYNQEDLVAARDRYGANYIRPGITGWAQIHGRDELEIPEKARLDGYYVQHLGPVIDLKCLLLTVKAVIKSDGVVEGGTGAMEKRAK